VQVALDAPDGSGLLVTLEPLKRLPTAAQFLQESQEYLRKQKARILKVTPPRTLQAQPTALERFVLEAVLGKERLVMDYYIARQASAGATLAARLLPGNDLAALQREVEAIARSLVILPK
jgi:hypothetical protein